MAEKLLANTDRYLDKAIASRDIIDLAMMVGHWGEVPLAAWDKVHQAYGSSADRAYKGALKMVSDRAYLAQCLAKMHMAPELVDKIPAVPRGQASFAPSAPAAAARSSAGLAAAARGVRAVYGRVLAAPVPSGDQEADREQPDGEHPAS